MKYLVTLGLVLALVGCSVEGTSTGGYDKKIYQLLQAIHINTCITSRGILAPELIKTGAGRAHIVLVCWEELGEMKK